HRPTREAARLSGGQQLAVYVSWSVALDDGHAAVATISLGGARGHDQGQDQTDSTDDEKDQTDGVDVEAFGFDAHGPVQDGAQRD
ncbi:MAG: hypothetical protein ACRDU9_04740, partial [Acidimicrobiia bacterium]